MRSANVNSNENSRNGSSLYNTPHDGNLARRSPKQGGRVSPTGRRSPTSYYDRITTARFVMPSTGKLMCTKLNRVIATMCKTDTAGACLCENFLNGHCDNGHRCHFAHVPRQYLWNYLVPRVNRESFVYEPGFQVRCYTPEMDTYYEIPSEFIFQTKGSEKYVELYNDNGDNFKEKFCLCPTILETGFCEKGYECEHVHCSVADRSLFNCIHTHVASAEAVLRYERLPANITVRVFQPNGEGDGEVYPGSDVLRTVGALQYEDAFNRAGTTPSLKMQHCAHFQNKKMCRLGDGCRFLHVVSLALSTPMQEDTVSPRLSPVADTNSTSPDDNSSPLGPNKATIRKEAAAFMAIQDMLRGEKATPPSVTANNRATITASQINEQLVSMMTVGMNEDQLNRRSPTRRNNPYGQDIA